VAAQEARAVTFLVRSEHEIREVHLHEEA